jgi:hypothetical protein
VLVVVLVVVVVLSWPALGPVSRLTSAERRTLNAER